MADHKGWTELKIPHRSGCPKLFHSFTNKDDNFELRLTDLMGIWTCSMSRNNILNAAIKQNSSIDPSESLKQTKVLISKLRDSLEAGDNSLFRDKKLSSKVVNIQTKYKLPKPLKPLEWTFTLLPQGAGEMAEQILRPCLHETSIAKTKVEHLLHTIKDKDHVISKLLDQIEQSSTDLSLAFPGITGLRGRKGRVTVGEARKHVPGMERFDEDMWNTQFDNSNSYDGFNRRGLDNLVSGSEKCPKHTAAQHEEWLKQLPDINGVALQESFTRRKMSNEPEPSHADVSGDDTAESTMSDDDDDDDFERQATPQRSTYLAGQKVDGDPDLEARPHKKPRLGRLGGQHMAARNLGASIGNDGVPDSNRLNLGHNTTQHSTSSSTVTDTDSDSGTPPPLPSPNLRSPPDQSSDLNKGKPIQTQMSPSPAAPTPSSPTKPSTPSRRLGRLGSKSNDNSPLSKSSTHGRNQREKRHGGEVVDSPSKNPAERTDAPTPSRRRLGRLGSPRSQSQILLDQSPRPSLSTDKRQPSHYQNKATGSDSDSDATQSDASSHHAIPLNIHGTRRSSTGENAASPAVTDSQSINVPSQPEPDPEPIKKEETIEERANRRREQLKQTITNTTNKRKRKF